MSLELEYIYAPSFRKLRRRRQVLATIIIEHIANNTEINSNGEHYAPLTV